MIKSSQVMMFIDAGMTAETIAESLKIPVEDIHKIIASETALHGDKLPCGMSKAEQQAVMARLVSIGLEEEDNKSAAVKALIYSNEEFHGRNEARAKGMQNSNKISIGQINVMIAKARQKSEEILSGNVEAIEA